MAQILTATRKGNGTRIVPENKDLKWLLEWDQREKVPVHETGTQRWIRKLTKQPPRTSLMWVRKRQVIFFSREEIFETQKSSSALWKLLFFIMAGDGLAIKNVRFVLIK